MKPVTDPELLRQLELKPVSDPELLKQLEAQQPESKPGLMETLTDPRMVAMIRAPDVGIMRGLRDIPDAAAQFVTRAGELLPGQAGEWFKGQREDVESKNAEAMRQYREAFAPIGGVPRVDPGRVIGNVAAIAPILGTLPAAGPGVLKGIGAGAVTGGVAGALQPVEDTENFWSEKAKQTGIGAGFGGAASGAMSVLARLISPKASTDSVIQALRERGVTPSPGQMLGGAMKRLEEKAASVPVVGDLIKAANRRAVEEFNIATIDKVLESASKSLPKGTKAGHEAVRVAHETLSQAYDDVLPKLAMKADAEFASDIAAVAQKARGSLTPDLAKTFGNMIDDIAGAPGMKGIAMPGREAQQIMTRLGKLSSQFKSAADPFQRNMGHLFDDVRAAFDDALIRSNPGSEKILSGLREAWKGLLRVENAAARSGAKAEGVFSPAQLGAASKALDTSLRKTATAQGVAPMQQWAAGAERILGSEVPNSGTADRALAALLGLSAGAGYFSPGAGMAMAAGSAAYTTPAQRALAVLLASRPGSAPAIAEGLRRTAPVAAAGGAAALAPLLAGQ